MTADKSKFLSELYIIYEIENVKCIVKKRFNLKYTT